MRRQRHPASTAGLAALLAAATLLQAAPARAQTAPPVPALPPAAQPAAPAEIQGGGPATRAEPPRAANPGDPSPQTMLPAPQPGAGDRGVITPPPSAAPGMSVPPPASGAMPVIPPPGSPRGDRGVVPK